jgi:D-3-phosphoglycerate dehydrogenase
MDVVAHSRTLTTERAAERGARAADLADTLEAADILTIHLTLTPETRGLIGAKELARMKPGAFLVNTARGPIVDQPALIAALESSHLAGAALDVYDVEPLPANHPFRTLTNVIALPHLGYVTAETYRAFYQGAVEDIEAWLDGAPVRVLNP